MKKDDAMRSESGTLTGAPEAGLGASAPTDKAVKVFLAYAEEDVRDQRDQLAVMLQKAGMHVVNDGPRPDSQKALRQQVKDELPKANISIHVLGGKYGERLDNQEDISLARYQYIRATKHAKEDANFKRFVWNFPIDNMITEGQQNDFKTEVNNTIAEDIMVTNVASGAQFIDDVKDFLDQAPEVRVLEKEYDIGFISSVVDSGECYEIIEQLGKGKQVQTLTVVPEDDTNFREKAEEVILRSRMAVVYFKDASDWAISFIKQIWKRVGGVSSGVPFVLIGEDEPRRNRFIKFKAPQIAVAVVKKEEVLGKLQELYTKVQETGRVIDEEFCPYTGLRPFNENESIFFKGREHHADTIIDMLHDEKFSMVTGASGDGKSSLLYAGVIPMLKGGFMKTRYTKWAVADFRPERQPLRNLSDTLARQLKIRNVDEVESTLSYGFSALVDMYKESDLYVDTTSEAYVDADEAIRKGLKRQAANLLILVDQFEEFFTNPENFRDGVASPLSQITVNVLLETIRIAREEDLPIYVVFTMRSDYIGQCVAFRGFAEMIGHSTYFVPRLKREEIQEVIEAPAFLNGDKVTKRLSTRILNDLGDGIDQLPVLQHAMHQVWTQARRNNSKELDLMHYAKVGGLAPKRLPKDDREEYQAWFNALPEDIQALYERPRLRNILNRHANELFLTAHTYYEKQTGEKISREDTAEVLRILFTCLTKIDESRAVRNRMTLSEISDILNKEGFEVPQIATLATLFREPGNTFIQPYIEEDDPATRELTENSILDITHEALIRNWDRLIEWAEREAKSVRIYDDFKVQVNRWLNNDCDSSYLLTSGPFNYFWGWYQDQQPTPAWIERYIEPEEINPEMEPREQAELYLEDIDEFLELSRRRIERNRRIIMFVIFLISLLFIMSLILAYLANLEREKALVQQRIAEENARLAEEQRLLAQKAALEAQNQRYRAEREKNNAELQGLIALFQKQEALSAKEEAERQQQLAEKAKEIAEKNRKIAENERKLALIQKQIAEDAKLEAEKQAEIAQIQYENAKIQRDNALTMQSVMLAGLSEEQTEQGEAQTAIPVVLEGMPENLDNPDDRPYVAETEASLYFAADAILNEEPLLALNGHKNKIAFNRFSPDGSQIITTSWDKSARIWDAESGSQVSALRGHTHIVDKAYFSPDNNWIITLAEDFTARLWNFRAKKEEVVYSGHGNLLTHATFSPDASKVVTTSIDNTARLWEAKSGNMIAVMESHTDDVVHAAFSPDGETFVTSSKDFTARVWNANNGSLVANLSGHSAPVNYAAYSPNGKYIVTVSDDWTAKVWNARSGQLMHTLVGHRDQVTHAAFSHSGTRVATASDDRRARVWNVATGKSMGVLRGHADGLSHITWSPTDQRIATTAKDGTARVWDGDSYLKLAVYDGHPANGYNVAFGPEGNKLLVAQGRSGVNVYRILPKGQELVNLVREEIDFENLTPLQKEKFYLEDKRLTKEIDQEQRLQEFERRKQEIEERRKSEGTAIPDAYREGDGSLRTRVSPGASSVNTPNPEPRSAYTPQPQAAPKYHVVKPQETLYKIAVKHNTSVDALKRVNGLQSNNIAIGQRLQLP